jgi:hypothetical protein
MSDFKLFDYLDPAIVTQESRDPKPTSVPSVWPSEASAIRIDQRFHNIVGKCMRQSYLRMIGRPVSNQVDAKGAWKWVTGKAMENIVVDLARAARELREDAMATQIYVANGVKNYVPDIYLPYELDIVVLDPMTGRPWIVECKTYDGYYAEQEIEKKGMPKLENLMQLAIYLLEVKNGQRMKDIILKSYEDRKRLDARGKEHRNRVEVDLEMVEKIDVTQKVGAKLVYISRGEVNRTEFTVEVEEDFDGSHYPVVNGQMLKIFTIESIYHRYKELQGYWFRARTEAVKRLGLRGILPPETLSLTLAPGDGPADRDAEEAEKTPEQKQKEYEYLDAVARETWKLEPEFLPPSEYEWAYNSDKVEQMWAHDELTKKAYEGWKKGKSRIPGDWQCKYCPQKTYCVPIQNPLWAHEVYDQNLVTISTNGGV